MKKILTLALAFSCGAALAQKADNVGIGTTKPDPSAILDLNSNTKGLLLPRMNQAQRDAIKNPAAGLVIFQTDQVVGTYTFDGTAWQPSNARTSAVSSVGAWDKQGNVIDGTDFLGSTNNQPLRFKVNNLNAGIISDGNTFLGYESGNSPGTGFSTGFGWNALKVNTGLGNTAVGAGALANVTSSGNTAFGLNALRGAIGAVTGATNTAFGGSALFKNTAGSNNVALGQEALYENTEGSYNFGLGTFALYKNTIGVNNIAIGANSMNKNVDGNYNIGIGNNSLSRIVNATSNNIAIGQDALAFDVSGGNNTAIGHNAGYNATGSSSVFIGYKAGYNETSNNMLYISNSDVSTPLIKGNFGSNWLRLNSKTSGYLVIGDFDTAPSATPGTGGIALPANIGVANGYRLVVQDGILCEKLKVALRSTGGDWADYVFEPDYKLMPLEDVEKFTKENKHLPNVPSAEEMVKNGLDLSKTSKMFMEKIEELTLHIIELNKRINDLESKK